MCVGAGGVALKPEDTHKGAGEDTATELVSGVGFYSSRMRHI